MDNNMRNSKMFQLFTIIVCLLVAHTRALDTSSSDIKTSETQVAPSAALKTIGSVLQDLQTAASYGGGGGGGGEGGGEGGDEGHEMGKSNKGFMGGMSKGSKKYDGNEWDKKGGDWGKNGHKKYDMGDKWANKKWDKKSMDQFGDKWSDNSGKKEAGKFEEWGDNKKWKTDKGKGYEKSYEYDKSDGMKTSYGKKGKNEQGKYDSKHGEKHGFNKKDMGGKDDFGKKVNNGKSGQNEWGKQYKTGGKNNKGMDFYEVKKPSSWKNSKWNKQQKKSPPPPPPPAPKKSYGGEADGGYEGEAAGGYQAEGGADMGQEYGGGETYDMPIHDADGAYDLGGGAELAYDELGGHVLGSGRHVTFADLKSQGYIVIDQTKG